MDITNSSDKNALVEWSKKVRDSIEKNTDESSVKDITQAIKGFQDDRFILPILGKAKRGKSTLLNALLGRTDDNVAPIDKLPISSVVSTFRFGKIECAHILFRDGHRESISFSQIREFVTEELNKENHKDVDIAEIEGPFPGLAPDLELVDTPGAGSLHEHHDAILHSFLPRADAVIFLVTARMPLDQEELDLLKQIKSNDIDKIFFAVNRADECSQQDLTDAIAHNLRLLSQVGVRVGTLHTISAKRAFQGDLINSGIPALMNDIARFLANNKGRVLATRFVDRVHAVARPVFQGVQIQLANSSKSLDQIDAELTALIQKKNSLEVEREFAEREFSSAWSKALELFDQGLNDAKAAVSGAVLGRIQRATVFDVSSLAKQLPSFLTQTIEEQLRPVASRFEELAREACERLQQSYPALSVGEIGIVAIRSREGNSALVGSVGGAAAAAVGTGVAAAGVTVGAGIAAANAAAAAATTTVAAPSIVSSLLTMFGFDFLAPLATGTATVAAPAAFTSTPLWVALSGPIGWTLVGVGVLAVPFSWRLSKLKLKDQIDEASQEQIHKVFARLRTERLPAIRNIGKAISGEIRLQLDRQVRQIESALICMRDNRPSELELSQLAVLAKRLETLLIGHRKGQSI